MNAHADIEHDMEGDAPDMNLETLFGDCRDAMLLIACTILTCTQYRLYAALELK